MGKNTVPTYQEVEAWHLIDKIKIHRWLKEMLNSLKHRNKR